MKYAISFKNSSFNISNSIAKAINSQKEILFKTKAQGDRTVFILNNSNIFFFQTISTDSSIQFYTMISNKRYRVTKQFYKFLNDYTKTVGDIGGTLRKKQCNKINEIITTPLT